MTLKKINKDMKYANDILMNQNFNRSTKPQNQHALERFRT